jgi:hypothetical protein
VLAVGAIEVVGALAGKFKVLLLVVAHGHMGGAVEENVGGLEHGV